MLRTSSVVCQELQKQRKKSENIDTQSQLHLDNFGPQLFKLDHFKELKKLFIIMKVCGKHINSINLLQYFKRLTPGPNHIKLFRG